jgi:hypothetical protein
MATICRPPNVWFVFSFLSHTRKHLWRDCSNSCADSVLPVLQVSFFQHTQCSRCTPRRKSQEQLHPGFWEADPFVWEFLIQGRSYQIAVVRRSSWGVKKLFERRNPVLQLWLFCTARVLYYWRSKSKFFHGDPVYYKTVEKLSCSFRTHCRLEYKSTQ